VKEEEKEHREGYIKEGWDQETCNSRTKYGILAGEEINYFWRR